MDKEYAKKILSETKRHYSLAADNFSRARSSTWPEIDSFFNKYFKDKNRVLDIGCGNGRFSYFFEKSSYLGIDSSEELIKIALKNHPDKKFQVADALDLPFNDNSFNGVFSISVLHHIPSKELRDKFFMEIKRVLEPGGIVLITVWDLWSNPKKRKEIIKNGWKVLINQTEVDYKDIKINWYGAKDCYVHCFSMRELKKIAKENGFVVFDSGRINLQNKKNWSNFYLLLTIP